jgi:hypothetical protein
MLHGVLYELALHVKSDWPLEDSVHCSREKAEALYPPFYTLLKERLGWGDED